ncbi:hypothetical protein ANCCEY_11458 [Ancylostoma ceylanicum]|uniref:Peptidase A1 domain-containing protein n=1 Tax=Ancylostoma ceylanicum TaxID=53326 RepID=A0A0D6LP90_9BILA|nr:hypothetical protein ANCCEY_11458 [Ancylostoma ceylanicum]
MLRPACKTKNKFVPEKSSTFKPMSTEFKIRCYGGVVAGVYANDRIHIGGKDEQHLTVPNAMFGLARDLTDAFEKAFARKKTFKLEDDAIITLEK